MTPMEKEMRYCQVLWTKLETHAVLYVVMLILGKADVAEKILRSTPTGCPVTNPALKPNPEPSRAKPSFA